MERRSRVFLYPLAWMLLLSVLALADGSAVTPSYVVVVPVANMYREATMESDVVSQATYSTNVSVVDDRASTSQNWVHVRTPDDYTGWIESIALKALDGKPYASNGRVVRVSQRGANVYREPDVTAHAPLLNLPWEARLEVVNEKVNGGERWLKIHLPDGRQGYIQQGDVSSDLTP